MIEKITKTVYRCTCELADCCGIDPKTGQPRPWESEGEKIPERCSWCKRRSWNGQDRRRKDAAAAPRYQFVRVKRCTACGSTEWKAGADGSDLCAGCGRTSGKRRRGAKSQPATNSSHKPTVTLPKPKRVRAVEKDRE